MIDPCEYESVLGLKYDRVKAAEAIAEPDEFEDVCPACGQNPKEGAECQLMQRLWAWI